MDAYTEFQLPGGVINAALLGGLVGFEREFAAKNAGLRTHTLIGCTAAFHVILGDHMVSSLHPQSLSAFHGSRVYYGGNYCWDQLRGRRNDHQIAL